jgi:hypothetical protein
MTAKEIKITFLAIVVLIIIGLTCNQQKPNIALQQKKAVTEYKRKLLTDKLNVLQNFDTIYMDRWHKSKTITKSFFDTVYLTAPDTCDKWIIMCENRLYAERQIADSTITIKDSIIGTQSQIIKEDSVLLWVAKSETKLKSDTIADLIKSVKKQKRKSFLKGFAWGFATREAVTQGINIINKVK